MLADEALLIIIQLSRLLSLKGLCCVETERVSKYFSAAGSSCAGPERRSSLTTTSPTTSLYTFTSTDTSTPRTMMTSTWGRLGMRSSNMKVKYFYLFQNIFSIPWYSKFCLQWFEGKLPVQTGTIKMCCSNWCKVLMLPLSSLYSPLD